MHSSSAAFYSQTLAPELLPAEGLVLRSGTYRYILKPEREADVVTIKGGPSPSYYKLKELLRRRIAEGELGPGESVPSERRLSDTFGVSRMTARRALVELVNDGLLFRVPGVGTFVSDPKLVQQMSVLTSFSEDITARGQVPSSRVLAAEMVGADSFAAARLQVRPGSLVFRLRRLRMANLEPIAVQTTLVAFEGCERLLAEDFEHASLYSVLTDKYMIPVVEAEEDLEASLAGEEASRLLGIEPHQPVIITRRTTFTAARRPVEYAESTYRGDRYRLHTHMARRPPQSQRPKPYDMDDL